MRCSDLTQTIGRRSVKTLCTAVVILFPQALCKATAPRGPTPSAVQGATWAERAGDLYRRLAKAVAEDRWSDVSSQAQALKTAVRELETALKATARLGAAAEPNAGPLARPRGRPVPAARPRSQAESGQAADLVRSHAGRPEDRKALQAIVARIPGHLDQITDTVQARKYRLARQAFDQLDEQWEALESKLGLPKPLELATPYDPNRPTTWDQTWGRTWVDPQGGFGFGFSFGGTGTNGLSGGFGMMQMTGPNGTRTWTFQPDSNSSGLWMGPASGLAGLEVMRVQVCRQQLTMLDRMVETGQWLGAGHAVQRLEHAVLDLSQALDRPSGAGLIRPRGRLDPLSPDIGDLIRSRPLRGPIRDKTAAASRLASQLREAVTAQDKDKAGQVSRELSQRLDEIAEGLGGAGRTVPQSDSATVRP